MKAVSSALTKFGNLEWKTGWRPWKAAHSSSIPNRASNSSVISLCFGLKGCDLDHSDRRGICGIGLSLESVESDRRRAVVAAAEVPKNVAICSALARGVLDLSPGPSVRLTIVAAATDRFLVYGDDAQLLERALDLALGFENGEIT